MHRACLDENVSPVQAPQVECRRAKCERLDRTYASVGRDARIRGFRQGRVPRAVLERMFGEQIRREVLTRLVEHSFHHAIEAERLDVVGAPRSTPTGTPGESFKYSATVDIRPDITAGEPPASSGAPGARGRRLRRRRGRPSRERRAAPSDRDRFVVEAGDVVAINVGTQLEGGEPQRREGALVEAGSGSFPLALEGQLVGHNKGAHVAIDVPYPADYGNAALAGKTVQFDVEIVDLKRKELPPLDDDFARDHGRADSLADLRARVRADLEAQASARADAAVQDALLEQLIARHEFDVPPSLVGGRCDALLSAFDMRIPEGPEGEQLVERLRVDVRPRAERDVRVDLLLDAIAAARGVTIDDTAVDAEIDTLARRQHRRLSASGRSEASEMPCTASRLDGGGRSPGARGGQVTLQPHARCCLRE
jgi:trigger factor